jgi:adenylate cyclase
MKTALARRRERRRAAQVVTLGLFTVLAVLLVAAGGNIGVLDRLSALAFDVYQQVRPRQEAGAPIVVIDIDEASLKRAGQWPWPRSELARIIDALGEAGAAAIALDFVFAEPDRTSLRQAAKALEKAGAQVSLPDGLPDNDEILAASFARNPAIAGFVLTNEFTGRLPAAKTGFAFVGRSPEEYLVSFDGAVTNLPVITEAAAAAGFFSFPPSVDGVVRMVPLVARGGSELYPSLSVEALRVAQGAGALVIRATGASGEADVGNPAMTALKIGDFEVPTGPAGEFRIYFSGLPSVPIISAADLLEPDASSRLADKIAGRIALIGSSAVGLRDIVATPLDAAVPGVLVHAEIIDQIFGGAFLTRPDWAPGAEYAAAVLFTLVLLAAVLSSGPLLGALAALATVALAVAVSWIAILKAQLMLDPILPSIAVLCVYSVVTAFILLLTDRERQFVRRAFAQYLAPSLVERLAENPGALSLGGETRELTILFSDIRGFTALSEELDPQEVARILNRFLTPMTNVLLESGATIDKYVGDAIMAFWNAPIATDDHARSACLAALRMQSALDALNQREGLTLKMGVGLHTGPACVGNLGSEQRFSYSAIGDAVNVASRVEGLSKEYGLPVLMTENTASSVVGLALLEVDIVRVVGRAQPLAIYALVGDDALASEPNFTTLAAVHSRMIASYRGGALEDFQVALDGARGLAPALLRPLYDLYANRLVALRERPRDHPLDTVQIVLRK